MKETKRYTVYMGYFLNGTTTYYRGGRIGRKREAESSAKHMKELWDRRGVEWIIEPRVEVRDEYGRQTPISGA